uniref:Odorant receptor n=1 Tax=Trichogramma kaykai TaxID=54128 RepID=A0ABD2XEV3_9HYME
MRIGPQITLNLETAGIIYRICEAVTIDWLSIKDPEEKNTMKVVCEQGSRMVRIHFGFLLPSLLGFVLAPVALPYLLNPYLPENMTLERTLCAHVELFIDQDKYFHHILIFLIHMVILIMLVISAMDLIYTSCITYVMGKIIWIGYVFEKLCEIETSYQNASAQREMNIYVYQTVIGLIK